MKLPSYLTQITKLSKTIVAVLFVLLPFIGFYYGRIYQKVITPTVSQNYNRTIVSNTPVNNTPGNEPTLLMKKPYKDYELGVFSPNLNERYLAHSVIFGPVVNNEIPKEAEFIILDANSSFPVGKMFEVIGDYIYIVNQRDLRIDVYTSEYIPANRVSEPSYALYEMQSKTIDFPETPFGGNFGTFYQMGCLENICTLSTAWNKEAGCTFTLNVETKTFSVPECYGDIGS